MEEACCSPSGNNILPFVYVTPVSTKLFTSQPSQHGAVLFNLMTVIVSEQAHRDLYICSNNTQEGCRLKVQPYSGFFFHHGGFSISLPHLTITRSASLDDSDEGNSCNTWDGRLVAMQVERC